MKVSVIIPIYNAEKYLEQCIQSVVNQTLKDVEIVLIDDGSTDGSAKICKDFMKQDSRITYYYKENEGLAAARQDGIERSLGQYIGFVDSDDWIEPDMYEKMYNAAKSCDGDVVLCNAFLNDERIESKDRINSGMYNEYSIKKDILPKTIIRIDEKGRRRNIRWSNCLRIYKRQMIEENNISFNRTFRRCQDLPFTLDNMLVAKSFYYLDEYLYHNRQDAGSLSRGYTKDMWNLIKPLIQHINEALKTRTDIDWKANNEASAFFLTWDSIANEFKKDAPKRLVKDHIFEIVNDPICQEGLDRIDGKKLNDYFYKVFYQNMKSKNAGKLIRDYRFYHSKFKNKILVPVIHKTTETKLYKIIRKR